MAEKLEPSESLMPKIRALLDPPNPEETKAKGQRLGDCDAEAVPRKSNHDCCDFCNEGGDLLCCDRCPCAFHLACCEPPVDPDNIPSGEWLCTKCRPSPTTCPDVIAPFDVLVKQCVRRNPTSFSLPPEFNFNTPLPGMLCPKSTGRKRKRVGEDSRLKSSTGSSSLSVPLSSSAAGTKVPPSSTLHNDPDLMEGDRSVRDFCFTCNRTKRFGAMVYCDFCPLSFHLDCLDPPLTNVPNTLWMCPNHAEHHMTSFNHPRLSSRCATMETAAKMLNQQTVVLDFLEASQRDQVENSSDSNVSLPKRRAIEVPSAIKSLYRHPVIDSDQCTLRHLCEAADQVKSRVAAKEIAKTLAGDVGSAGHQDSVESPQWWNLEQANVREQDQWLENVVQLQYDASCYLSLPSAVKQRLSRRQTSKVCSNTNPAAAPTLRSSSPEDAHPEDMDVSELPSPTVSATTSMPSSPREHCDSYCSTSLQDTPIRHNVCTGAASVDSEPSSAEQKICDGGGAADVDSMQPRPRRARRGPILQTDNDDEWYDGEVDDGQGVGDGCRVFQQLNAIRNDHFDYALPDVRRFDQRLVHLLATQRLQQILSSRNSSSGCASRNLTPVGSSDTAASHVEDHVADHTGAISSVSDASNAAASASDSNVAIATGDALPTGMPSPNTTTENSGQQARSEPQLPARSITRAEVLSAKALLCPVSGMGPPFPLSHQSINIGLGMDMDLCLRFYAPCQRLSQMHASMFYDECQQQFELLSYSEHGVHVDGVLYGCDLSHPLPSPGVSPLSVDHVRSSGLGPRAKRAQERVESARRRWRQPHSMRYLQDLLSYCAEGDSSADEDSGISIAKDTSEVTHNSDSDDDLSMLSTSNTGAGRSGVRIDSSSPNSLLHPNNLPVRPPRSPSPISACLSPTDSGSTWLHRQEKALRTAGFWLPVEAEKSFPHCLCSADNGGSSVSSCLPGNWEGSAFLRHGSTVRFGCVRFVLSIAGQPGHDQLVKSILQVVPLTAESRSLPSVSSTSDSTLTVAASADVAATAASCPRPSVTVTSSTTSISAD